MLRTDSDDEDSLVVEVASTGVCTSTIWTFLEAIWHFHSYLDLNVVLPFFSKVETETISLQYSLSLSQDTTLVLSTTLHT